MKKNDTHGKKRFIVIRQVFHICVHNGKLANIMSGGGGAARIFFVQFGDKGGIFQSCPRELGWGRCFVVTLG